MLQRREDYVDDCYGKCSPSRALVSSLPFRVRTPLMRTQVPHTGLGSPPRSRRLILPHPNGCKHSPPLISPFSPLRDMLVFGGCSRFSQRWTWRIVGFFRCRVRGCSSCARWHLFQRWDNEEEGSEGRAETVPIRIDVRVSHSELGSHQLARLLLLERSPNSSNPRHFNNGTPAPAPSPSHLLTNAAQSMNIDKSLDDIITTKKSRSRQAPRGGGIARRGAPARAAAIPTGPAGGGQRRAPQVAQGALPGLEGVVGDKIVVSNLPEDVTEQQIKVGFSSLVGLLVRWCWVGRWGRVGEAMGRCSWVG